tara:strand:- start:4563 stop:5600 length:1038 start_codon:yes stop_codon:yes gene_type:complete
MKNILICGGSGFIGSNFIRSLINNYRIINLDLLTYAASSSTLNDLNNKRNYNFIKGNISNIKILKSIFKKYKPEYVINFAAETHVDRSIDSPSEFVNTNILGVFNLINYCMNYYKETKNKDFKFVQVSTDEVYGSVIKGSSIENSNLSPNSPYAATKTSADHLIISYYKTFNFPAIIARSSNNYGPYQFPEKLIPLIILNAIENKKLPLYGNGKHIRNWLFVEDNVNALKKVLFKGKKGNIYNIGGKEEISNLILIKKICRILDKILPRENKKKYESLIEFVSDRPGHDKRYSLNSNKIKKELKWKPRIDLNLGLELTINWYLKNKKWWLPIRKFKYKGERLGKK